jgi:tetratricopeptide (TPR) repeat protein
MPVLTRVFLTLAGMFVQAGAVGGVAAQTPPKAARDAFEKAAKAAQNKKTDQAVSNYQKAVALYPDYAEAWCELGKLQLAQN